MTNTEYPSLKQCVENKEYVTFDAIEYEMHLYQAFPLSSVSDRYCVVLVVLLKHV